jgi:hypothetical protein
MNTYLQKHFDRKLLAIFLFVWVLAFSTHLVDRPGVIMMPDVVVFSL